jgi:5-deoxy-glucuronate isomerase
VRSRLLVRPEGEKGRVIHVTPASAGWTYVGFDLWKLLPGEKAEGHSRDRETCLVFVAGKGSVIAGEEDFGEIGERASPFEGRPWSVYVPAGMRWLVTATTPVELGACSAPAKGRLGARVIAPHSLGQQTRGKGSNIRHVTDILPETEAGESLLICEVITPAGHSSSYPPHKHDRDDLPRESQLEETYYHRLNPVQGFAFQRVYTDDRLLDEAMAVEDGDLTLVPKGYHPCAAPHGYDLYYLNVMAGPKRTWKIHNAPEHEWLLK